MWYDLIFGQVLGLERAFLPRSEKGSWLNEGAEGMDPQFSRSAPYYRSSFPLISVLLAPGSPEAPVG